MGFAWIWAKMRQLTEETGLVQSWQLRQWPAGHTKSWLFKAKDCFLESGAFTKPDYYSGSLTLESADCRSLWVRSRTGFMLDKCGTCSKRQNVYHSLGLVTRATHCRYVKCKRLHCPSPNIWFFPGLWSNPARLHLLLALLSCNVAHGQWRDWSRGWSMGKWGSILY